MASSFSRRDFLPAGLKAEQVELVGNTIRVHSRSARPSAGCPHGGTISRHVHSRHLRRPADLPAHGRRVELVLLVRRFRCRAIHCPAKIFAERFPPAATRPHARRTLAPGACRWFPGQPPRRRRMGHMPAPRRPSHTIGTREIATGTQDCPSPDHGPGSSLQGRCHPGCKDRSRVANPCHSPSADRPVHRHGA